MSGRAINAIRIFVQPPTNNRHSQRLLKKPYEWRYGFGITNWMVCRSHYSPFNTGREMWYFTAKKRMTTMNKNVAMADNATLTCKLIMTQ